MNTEQLKTAEEMLIQHGYEDFVNCDPPSKIIGVIQNFASQESKRAVEEFKKADKLLKKIRHILTYRDTDDAILDQIRKEMNKGGYPFVPED